MCHASGIAAISCYGRLYIVHHWRRESCQQCSPVPAIKHQVSFVAETCRLISNKVSCCICEAVVCYGGLARLVDFSNSRRVVFDTLYLLLSFGHETPEEADKLDPPFSYFRLRLICSLLETCGQFFNKGLAKKRLDRFLVFFQRYLLAKPPLPLDVEFDVQVCSLHLCKTCMSMHDFHSTLQY